MMDNLDGQLWYSSLDGGQLCIDNYYAWPLLMETYEGNLFSEYKVRKVSLK